MIYFLDKKIISRLVGLICAGMFALVGFVSPVIAAEERNYKDIPGGEDYVFGPSMKADIDKFDSRGITGTKQSIVYAEVSVPAIQTNREEYIAAQCADRQLSYAEAGSCHLSCVVEKNLLSDNVWGTGSQCGDKEIVGFTFVIPNTVAENDGCSDTAEECQRKSRPYTFPAVGTDNNHSCMPETRGDQQKYCFAYSSVKPIGAVINNEDRLIGQGMECAVLGYNLNNEPGQSERRATALSQCNKKKAEYKIPSGDEANRACKDEFEPFGNIANWTAGDYTMCFDATNLVKYTGDELRRVRDEQNRIIEDEIRKQQEEQNRIQLETKRGTTFGAPIDPRTGKAAGIVPACGDKNGKGAACGWIELVALANNVVTVVIWIASFVVVLMLLFAGFKLVTARGNASALTEAREMITRAIVGFLIVLFAWLIVSTVLKSLLRSDLQNDDVVNLLEN